MEQLQFTLQSPTQESPTRIALLVDTAPSLTKQKKVINIGMELVAESLKMDVCHWQDIVDVSKYETVGFSVMYPLYILNIPPFLKRNNIPVLKNKRERPHITAGGQGATTVGDALSDIVDETFYGEADGDCTDSKGWTWAKEITSKPIIKDGRAVIEVARGCNHRCKFCEYAWITGGKYREKDIGLVKDQIDSCVVQGIKQVALRTANLPAYSRLDELMEHCLSRKVHQGWSDIAVLDADKILKWLKPLRISAPKIGVESFDEATRIRIGKGFTDKHLEHILYRTMQDCSLLHLFLIYGLPEDDYGRWYIWARKLAKMRSQFSHPIRINFSITNLNLCKGTPLYEKARNHQTNQQPLSQINFEAKDIFIQRWVSVLKEVGLCKPHANMGYGRDYGRHGRNEESHLMIMAIRHGGKQITPALIHTIPRGVYRYVRKYEAVKFLQAIEQGGKQ